jgi:hypothetical protein
MTVLVLGAVRSCGVTTLATALAATWPGGRRVLLAELDPAGGTLAAGSGWPPEPGLVSLAAAARRGGDPTLVWEQCQELPGGVAVLAGPASADHARTALGMLGPLLARFGELDADVLADCGRLDPGTPNPGMAGADRVVLVARPRLADLHALATWRENHLVDARNLGLVLVGDGPYPDDEIAGALGVEILARLPWDPAAADALVSVPASARELRFAPLVRAARTLADRLATSAPSETAGTAASEPEAAEAGRLRLRVLRTWRAAPAAPSANGNAPEGVGR